MCVCDHTALRGRMCETGVRSTSIESCSKWHTVGSSSKVPWFADIDSVVMCNVHLYKSSTKLTVALMINNSWRTGYGMVHFSEFVFFWISTPIKLFFFFPLVWNVWLMRPLGPRIIFIFFLFNSWLQSCLEGMQKNQTCRYVHGDPVAVKQQHDPLYHYLNLMIFTYL